MPRIYETPTHWVIHIEWNFIGKILIAIAVVSALFACCSHAHAQEPCPSDKVCISREAAVKAVADAKTVDAQKVEIDALNKAIADYKQQLNDMRVQFAEMSGEATILKQRAVSDAAMIQLLMQNVKKKRNAFITFF